jgi:hypothetical protein|nr:MAG TPA: hypothetical protein [Caudoviricetes sp.]
MKVQVTHVTSRPNELYEDVNKITNGAGDTIILHLSTGELITIDTQRALTKII